MQRETAPAWTLPLREDNAASSWLGALVGAAIGLVLCLAMVAGVFSTWRLRAMDLLYQPLDTRSPVAIITIDDETLHEYGRLSSWSRERYAELIEKLRTWGARVIVIDILLPEPAEGDDALSEALDDDVVLAAAGLGAPRFASGVVRFPYLLKPIVEGGTIGHVNTFPDRDGVLRKLPLWIEGDRQPIPAMAWQSVALYLGVETLPPQSRPFTWAGREMPVDESGQVILRYLGPGGSIPTYSMLDVMNDELPAGALSGRIVFIGATAAGMPDVYSVPVGGWMNGVEVQAQMTAALLAGQTLHPPSLFTTFILTVLMAVLAGWSIVRFRPSASALIVITATLLLLRVAVYLFSRGFLLDYFFPLLGMFAAYVSVGLWVLEQERWKRASITSLFAGRASPQVVDYLQEQARRNALTAAETRFIVALFADVRGYTGFTEREDPRRVQSVINAYLAAFAEAVIDADGVVTKYVGDRVVALFNAPYHIEHPVERALEAAVDGLHRLERLWEDPEMPRLSMGVGINAGMAIVGLVGSPRRYDYDALGDVVNVASRLCDLAPAGEVYVTEAIVALLDESWEMEMVGSLALKGRREPVVTYRLKSAIALEEVV